MLNLLRMDLRRMFRGKGLYICLGVLMFTTVFTFMLMYVIQDPEMRQFLIKHGMTITASGNIKESLNLHPLWNFTRPMSAADYCRLYQGPWLRCLSVRILTVDLHYGIIY
ncbi:MAG: hypothetical protein ACLRMZ_13900 [Blautia marasmi]